MNKIAIINYVNMRHHHYLLKPLYMGMYHYFRSFLPIYRGGIGKIIVNINEV